MEFKFESMRCLELEELRNRKQSQQRLAQPSIKLHRRFRKHYHKDKNGLRAWVLEAQAFRIWEPPEGLKLKRVADPAAVKFRKRGDSVDREWKERTLKEKMKRERENFMKAPAKVDYERRLDRRERLELTQSKLLKYMDSFVETNAETLWSAIADLENMLECCETARNGQEEEKLEPLNENTESEVGDTLDGDIFDEIWGTGLGIQMG